MSQKVIWNYSERILTGYTILIIGTIAAGLGYYYQNPLALALGLFAISLGYHRLGYARGMRDMHAIDQKLPLNQRLKDFSLYAETEDTE